MSLNFLIDELDSAIREITTIKPQKLKLVVNGEQRIAHATSQLHKDTHLLGLLPPLPQQRQLWYLLFQILPIFEEVQLVVLVELIPGLGRVVRDLLVLLDGHAFGVAVDLLLGFVFDLLGQLVEHDGLHGAALPVEPEL